MADAIGFVLNTTFAFVLLVFCTGCAVCRCAFVCATIGLNGDFVGDVRAETSIFGGTSRLLLLLFLLVVCRVFTDTSDIGFGALFDVFNAVMENGFAPVFTFVCVEVKPKPFGFDTGVGDFVMVAWFRLAFVIAIGMGDEVFAFGNGFCVVVVFAFVCCTNSRVIVTVLPVCLADVIGLNVNVLFTPAATGGVFDDDAVAAAVVATLRAVTVSALFLLIAATASFVGSLCFAFICGGLRIIDAVG